MHISKAEQRPTHHHRYQIHKVYKLLCSVFSIILFSSCSIGPNYTPPAPPIHHWTHAPQTNHINYTQWWRHFHDPILNTLIEKNATSNIHIEIAEARIQTAKTKYSLSYAQLYPELGANILPPNATGFDLAQVFGLMAHIEPDLFGKQREGIKQARALVEVQQAEKDYTLLKLQAEIATDYIQLRAIQTKNYWLKKNDKQHQNLLSILKSKYHKGQINYISIAQQKALIESELAKLEENDAIETAIIHKLEALTGQQPGSLIKQLSVYHPIPAIAPMIHLTAPSQLLRRRPDIIIAEKRVQAAHANIRIAMAELFPKITLGWLLAWQTQSLATTLFALQGPQSAFFGLLDAPLLSIRLSRIVDLRKREKALAVLIYELTVLNAFHEVETEQSYCIHRKISALHFKRALEQKKLVLYLTNDAYQKGVQDYSQVLVAEKELNNLEIAYLRQVVNYHLSQIKLYQALGGDVIEHNKI